jgi:hypothetical protein
MGNWLNLEWEWGGWLDFMNLGRSILNKKPALPAPPPAPAGRQAEQGTARECARPVENEEGGGCLAS